MRPIDRLKVSMVYPDPYPDETVQEIIEKARLAQLRYLERIKDERIRRTT